MPLQEIDLNDLDDAEVSVAGGFNPRVTRYGRRASRYRPSSPAPRMLPGDTPEDVRFWDSLRQKSVATQDRPDPEIVLADPERIKRARTLAITLEIPFAAAYQAEPQLSAEMERRDPGWFKKARDSFMFGVGDMYVTAGRALELAGATNLAQTYVGFGRYVQEAYLPTEQPKEFTWSRLIDPDWYATTIARAVPSSLALIPAAIVGGYVGLGVAGALRLGSFGKLILGSIGGATLSRPIEAAFEAGGHYEDALQRGLRSEEAEKQAALVFRGNLALAGLDAAQLAIAFTPLSRIPGAGKALATRIAAATGKFASVAVLEGAEEGYQTALQQWARGERLSFDPEMNESIAAGMVFGAGLAGAGSVFNALTGRIENTMPPKLAEQFEAEKRAALAQGLTEQAAEIRALDRIAETPEGKAHVEKVIKDLKDLAEGKEPAPVTVEEQNKSIEQAAEQEGIAERADLEVISDEDLDSIAKGDVSIDEVLGLEPVEPAPQTFIVSEDAYKAAQARLKEKIGGLHAGVDPTAIADMVVIGAYHLERGVRTFAEWSKVMIERFGDAIKKHLDDIWSQSNDMVKRGVKSGMAEPMAQAEAIEGARQAPSRVREQVRRATGLEKISRLVREDEALRASLKKAEQAARIAYKVGTADAIARAKADIAEQIRDAQLKAKRFGFREGFKLAEKMTRKELIAAFKDSAKSQQETRQALFEMIQENLPPDMRGKFIQSLVGEVSKRKQESVLRRIEQTKEMLDKKELIEDIEGLASFKGKVALEYSRKIQELVKDIDLKTMSPRTRKKLEDLKIYAEMHGMPSGIRAETLRQLERLEKKPVQDLTADDLKPLVEQMKHLEALGKLKLQLKNKYNERQRQLALRRLLNSTKNADPKTNAGKIALKTYIETLQAPRVGEIFDGYKAGENTRLVKRLQNADTDVQWDIRTTMDSALAEIRALGITTLDDAANLRIMVNLRALEGATDQVATLMEHYGLQEIPQLKKVERELIEVLRKYSNGDNARLVAMFEEMTNTPFPILESRILPLKYEGEPRISEEEAIIQRFRKRTQTEQGFTIERRRGVKRLPRIDVLKIFEEGISETKWYLHMQPVLDDIARLVKTKEYIDAAGEVASNWWKDHLDIIARRGISADAARLPFDSFLKWSRGNLQTAILGWKLSSILMQPFAVFDAMAYAQGRLGTSAALKVAGEFTKTWIVPGYAKDYIAESEKLKLRATGELAVQEALEEAGHSQTLRAKFIRGGMELLKKADVRTAAAAQKAFEKILVDEGMSITEARREAGILMELTASSPDITFRPHILSRGETWRTVFTFQSFMLNRWGLVTHDLIAKGLVKGDYKAKLRAMMGLGIIITGMIAEDEARRYVYELTRGTKMPDRPAWQDAIFGIPELVPLFGGIFSQFNTGRARVPPLARTIEEALGPFIDPDNPRRWIRSVKSVIAITTGLPGTAQTADLIEGILLPPEKPGKIKKRAIEPRPIKTDG